MFEKYYKSQIDSITTYLVGKFPAPYCQKKIDKFNLCKIIEEIKGKVISEDDIKKINIFSKSDEEFIGSILYYVNKKFGKKIINKILSKIYYDDIITIHDEILEDRLGYKNLKEIKEKNGDKKYELIDIDYNKICQYLDGKFGDTIGITPKELNNIAQNYINISKIKEISFVLSFEDGIKDQEIYFNKIFQAIKEEDELLYFQFVCKCIEKFDIPLKYINNYCDLKIDLEKIISFLNQNDNEVDIKNELIAFVKEEYENNNIDINYLYNFMYSDNFYKDLFNHVLKRDFYCFIKILIKLKNKELFGIEFSDKLLKLPIIEIEDNKEDKSFDDNIITDIEKFSNILIGDRPRSSLLMYKKIINIFETNGKDYGELREYFDLGECDKDISQTKKGLINYLKKLNNVDNIDFLVSLLNGIISTDYYNKYYNKNDIKYVIDTQFKKIEKIINNRYIYYDYDEKIFKKSINNQDINNNEEILNEEGNTYLKILK